VDFAACNDFEIAGVDPQEIVVGDFDQDGFPDLAITANGDKGGETTILLNDGAGNFNDDQPFITGISTYGIAARDFNGDDILDLALAEGGLANYSVQVYLGDGTGQFSLLTVLTAGNFPIDLVSEDFNEDGKADLAIASNVSLGLSIALGNGDGTFSTPQPVPGAYGLKATDLAAADLDQDGHLDLALAHFSGVQILLGAGDGTFSANGSAGSNGACEAVALGDLNGDGTADVAQTEILNGRLLVSFGHGDGTFSNAKDFYIGTHLRDVAIADLNLDGITDIMVAYEFGNNVSILLGDGGGTFLPIQSFSTSPEPRAVAVGDWNLDGLPDLALPCRNLGQTPYASVLMNQTAPSPWVFLGLGLAGTQGIPLLKGLGDPKGGTTVDLSLESALPNSLAVFILGFNRIDLPIMGGTLVPSLDFYLFNLPVDPQGKLVFPLHLPSNLNPGLEAYFQFWIQDGQAPNGYSSSNGLEMTTI
jgi:hypothetical protein